MEQEKGAIDSNITEEHNLASSSYIKWFSELSHKDVAIAGGKGASLAEMYNHKFPVPPAFIITAQAFDFFLGKLGLKERIHDIIKQIDMEDTAELQDASKKIRALIENEEMPKELQEEILEAYHILGSEKIDERAVSQDALNILKNAQEPIFVSVRSSATTEDLAEASFAGQQETFLNVKGDSAILENVKKCFSSLYTSRAIYYRKKQGFTEEESLLAIVVQKMVDSAKSGVMFSRNPVNVEDDDVIIEAVFGLGEGIVSGKIKPDNYIVSRDLKVKSTKLAEKKIAIVRNSAGENAVVKLSPERSESQVLTNAELLELADYGIKLEDHYKKPQDIEFAVEDHKVYIVQSRPVTTGQKVGEKIELTGNVLLEGLGSSPGIGVGTVKIIEKMEDLPKIKKGDILVTEMTNPDMVISMAKSAAIVTDEGGMTAHASIVSREMGIPAVVGTGEATTKLKDGMKITVDGTNGKVYEGEVAEAKTAEIKKIVPVKRVKIKLIVDLPEYADRGAESGAEYVGLTRIEGMIASMKKHPLQYEKEGKLDDYTELLRDGIEKIARPFKGVWIRASDIRSDEYSSLEGAPEKEINPMLGLHGIRFLLKHPKILEAEMAAVKKVAEANPDKKIGIMVPLVISIDEVKRSKEFYNKYKTKNTQFGVMIETPASVQIIDDICDYVDFISFGTNDLTQFTLAVDRGEDEVQYLYDELNPAVFSEIKRVIGACRRKKVETSICGQAGSKKKMAEFLFKKGIDSISVNADAAYDISSLIKELEDKRESEFESRDSKPDKPERQENKKQERQDKSESNEKQNLSKEEIEEIKREKKRERRRRNRKRKKEMRRNNNNNLNNPGNNKEQQKKEERKEQHERKEFITSGHKYKDVSKDSPLPKFKDEFDDKRANVKVYNEDMKALHEEGLLNKKRIQIPAEVEEEIKSNEYKEDIGPIQPLDDLDRIDDKAEDIKEKVEEKNEERQERAEEFSDKIKVEKDSSDSDSSGVYKPDNTEEENKPESAYNFDEE